MNDTPIEVKDIIPLHRIETTNIITILQKMSYECYFRTMMTCKWLGTAVRANQKFQKELPEGINLKIIDSPEGPALKLEDFNWESESEDFDRWSILLTDEESSCFYGFRFNKIEISPADWGEIFTNTKDLIEFFERTKMSCRELKIIDVDSGDLKDVIKILQPERLNMCCKYSKGHLLLKEKNILELGLNYVQLYINLTDWKRLIPAVIGHIPRLQITLVGSLTFDKQVFCNLLTNCAKRALALPRKQCCYLKISVSFNQNFDWPSFLPSLDELKMMFNWFKGEKKMTDVETNLRFNMSLTQEKEDSHSIIRIERIQNAMAEPGPKATFLFCLTQEVRRPLLGKNEIYI